MYRSAIAVALGSALLLTACSAGEGSADGATDNEVSVSEISYGATPPKDDVIGQALKNDLGLDVKLNAVGSSDDYYAQLSASLAGGDAPCRMSRMSASSAACAVSCRGSASSNGAEPVIANGSTSRSVSARAKARSVD